MLDSRAKEAPPNHAWISLIKLVSDLSRRVTGQTLVVDGGSTTKFPYAVG